MAYLLGIDAGTTAMKVVLFNEQGNTVATALEEYQLITPDRVTVELDPETYWTACVNCIRSVLRSSGVPAGSLAALAIASQGETFITLDRDGQPLGRAIVWLDNRSSEEANIIGERFGVETIYRITGSPEVVPTWAATKILWLSRKAPRLFDRVHKYVFVEDYLIYRLTGRFTAECALYTSSLLVDINKWTWWDEMLSFLGISPSQLPELLDPGTPVGHVWAKAAAETGLSTHTVVVTGGMDQSCGCVGSGNIRPGVLTETTGASLNICATTDEAVFHDQRKVPVQCHSIKGKYILLPWCTTAGMMLRWFRDEFSEVERRAAAARGSDIYEVMCEKAAQVPTGAEGLLVLPHLAGAMSPEYNERARGVFFDIGLHHTRAHFIRAILEAVAYMLKSNVDLLEQMGVTAAEMRLLGGAARSTLWNQIKADVTGKTAETLRSPEAACLGAAILAGTAIGLFGSVTEACNAMVTVGECYSPDPTRRQVYEQCYSRYLALYNALNDAFWKK